MIFIIDGEPVNRGSVGANSITDFYKIRQDFGKFDWRARIRPKKW